MDRRLPRRCLRGIWGGGGGVYIYGGGGGPNTTHPNKNSLHKQFAQTLLPLFCLFEGYPKGPNLEKIQASLKISSELEIFKRATHQTYFLWGILEVRIEHFKRD